jgi:adenylylsulfate kinase
MRIVASEKKQAFAVWITGLPASGKSTITRALTAQCAALGVDVAVLESDELRKILTPEPRYDDQEREKFYSQMNYIGALLARHGIPVIFDATANRRAWRDEARRNIANFIEVYVDSPIEVCIARDPKGIYREGRAGRASTVPGLQAEYEPPVNPDVVIEGAREAPDAAAQRVIATLNERGWLRGGG